MKGRIGFIFEQDGIDGEYNCGILFDTKEIEVFETRIKAAIFAGLRTLEQKSPHTAEVLTEDNWDEYWATHLSSAEKPFLSHV